MASIKLALKTDANNPVIGDLYIGPDGNFAMTSTLSEEVAQLLYTRFRLFRGEWFLQPEIGVPYYQSILGVKVSLTIVSRILQQVVSTCPGVASVDQFLLVPQAGRGVQVTFSCTLTDGVVLNSADFSAFVVGQ